MKTSDKILILGRILGCLVMIYPIFFLIYSLYVVYSFRAALYIAPLVLIWAVLVYHLFLKKIYGQKDNKSEDSIMVSEQSGAPLKTRYDETKEQPSNLYSQLESIRTEINSCEKSVRIMAIAGIWIAWLYEDYKQLVKKGREINVLLLHPNSVTQYEGFYTYEQERRLYKEFVLGPFKKTVSEEFKERIKSGISEEVPSTIKSLIETSTRLWTLMKNEVETETHRKAKNFELRFLKLLRPPWKGFIIDEKRVFLGDYAIHAGVGPLRFISDEQDAAMISLQFETLWGQSTTSDFLRRGRKSQEKGYSIE